VDFELIHVLCCHIGFLRDPIGVYRELEPLRGFCIAFHLSDEASDGYAQADEGGDGDNLVASHHS
jgi:hypothetical protein